MGRGIEWHQGKENRNHWVKGPTSKVTKPCTVECLITRNLINQAIEGTEHDVKFIRYCIPDKNTWHLCSSKKCSKENQRPTETSPCLLDGNEQKRTNMYCAPQNYHLVMIRQWSSGFSLRCLWSGWTATGTTLNKNRIREMKNSIVVTYHKIISALA